MSECPLCGGSGIHRMAGTWICLSCGGTGGRNGPPQPATGYTKNVTPRGPVVRPEDAFPESCCEGGPMEESDAK